MAVDPAAIGIAMQIASQGASAFQQYVPKLADIRKSTPDENPALAADVRLGEVAAVTLTVGIGVIASALTGSSAPAIIAVIICIVLIVLYESALNKVRPFENVRVENA